MASERINDSQQSISEARNYRQHVNAILKVEVIVPMISFAHRYDFKNKVVELSTKEHRVDDLESNCLPRVAVIDTDRFICRQDLRNERHNEQNFNQLQTIGVFEEHVIADFIDHDKVLLVSLIELIHFI